MTPRETSRAEYRVGLFKRRGWPSDRANAFAELLRLRDADRDDRRACIECKSLQRQGTCFKAQRGLMPNVRRDWTPIQDVLSRCAHFDFQKP